MKEFEKWWDENEDHYNAIRGATKDGWRAALEMVKSEIFEHREALDVIEEELEEN